MMRIFKKAVIFYDLNYEPADVILFDENGTPLVEEEVPMLDDPIEEWRRFNKIVDSVLESDLEIIWLPMVAYKDEADFDYYKDLEDEEEDIYQEWLDEVEWEERLWHNKDEDLWL